MTWSVVYEDGESEFGLCQDCVRPFRPYEIGEAVGWRNKQGTYENARIEGVDTKTQTYAVMVGSALHKGVGSTSLRRVVKQNFTKGSRVQVYVAKEEDWYPGTITRVNDDLETYAVQFDDGDFLESVELRYIASAATHDG
jgi:hypothetical protein